jgi:acetate kinase
MARNASWKAPQANDVLVLDAGSSSLKFQLIATDRDAIAANREVRLCRGQIDRFGGEVVIAVLKHLSKASGLRM